MLKAVECRLFIPGQKITLARQELWAAWAGPSRGAQAPKVLPEAVTPPPVAQADRPKSGGRPGVPPESAWTCPAPQPIKGNFTTSLRRAVHLPRAGRAVLRQNEAGAVLRDRAGSEAGWVSA